MRVCAQILTSLNLTLPLSHMKAGLALSRRLEGAGLQESVMKILSNESLMLCLGVKKHSQFIWYLSASKLSSFYRILSLGTLTQVC